MQHGTHKQSRQHFISGLATIARQTVHYALWSSLVSAYEEERESNCPINTSNTFP